MKSIISALICIYLFSANLALGGLVFTCGNHNPKHSTGTFEEAKRLTRDQKCANWFVGSTDSSLGSEELSALRKQLAKVLEEEKVKEQSRR
jgi:uncharacterized membrane protein